jgi:hypothetical protein
VDRDDRGHPRSLRARLIRCQPRSQRGREPGGAVPELPLSPGGAARGLPLAGVTAVSVEQAVAAPFATRQLADLGARVIKVERPPAVPRLGSA